MFKKKTGINLTINKNSELCISISWDNKDADSINRLSKLLSALESDNLNEHIYATIFKTGEELKDIESAKKVINNMSCAIENRKKNIVKEYLNSQFCSSRRPIISPDVVLPTFKNSINI